jgi:hypothetical protein
MCTKLPRELILAFPSLFQTHHVSVTVSYCKITLMSQNIGFSIGDGYFELSANQYNDRDNQLGRIQKSFTYKLRYSRI